MADTSVRRTTSGVTDQSIGDLVSVAARDISQLVRYELDLAKLELKSDVKRGAIGGGLMAVGGFAVCLVLVVLCFAFAYGLNTLGIWLWASFLVVAGTLVLLTGLAMLIGFQLVRRMTGLSKTRRGLSEVLALLHRGRDAGSAATKA